jgi:hypothetical protein
LLRALKRHVTYKASLLLKENDPSYPPGRTARLSVKVKDGKYVDAGILGVGSSRGIRKELNALLRTYVALHICRCADNAAISPKK